MRGGVPVVIHTSDAAADRDRQFAEAVRKISDDLPNGLAFRPSRFTAFVMAAHLRIYGTPCTAATPDGEKEK